MESDYRKYAESITGLRVWWEKIYFYKITEWKVCPGKERELIEEWYQRFIRTTKNGKTDIGALRTRFDKADPSTWYKVRTTTSWANYGGTRYHYEDTPIPGPEPEQFNWSWDDPHNGPSWAPDKVTITVTINFDDTRPYIPTKEDDEPGPLPELNTISDPKREVSPQFTDPVTSQSVAFMAGVDNDHSAELETGYTMVRVCTIDNGLPWEANGKAITIGEAYSGAYLNQLIMYGVHFEDTADYVITSVTIASEQGLERDISVKHSTPSGTAWSTATGWRITTVLKE